MMYDLARTERLHRAISGETTTGALRPKRCACGKATHAKQLVQYGVCIACHWDACVASLESEDHHPALHAGCEAIPALQWGNRNVYLGNRRGLPILQLLHYHGSAAGCKLAGLSGARICRAMDS